MKKFGILLLCAMLLVGAAAPALAGASDRVHVSVWHTFTKDQEAYINQAVADFNASQDKVQVEALTQPYAGFTDAVYNAVNEGIGPDIIFNYASEATKYLDAGKLADLSQFIYDEEIGIPGFDTSLVEGVMNGEVKAFADGLIHYLPAYTTGPIFFYNKTMYDELGLTAPKSWQDVEDAAKVIKEKKNIPGFAIDGLTDFVQMLIMETEGAGYIDTANKKVKFDTPEVRAKIEWLVNMVKEGYFAIKPSDKYFSDDFNAAVVASFFGSVAGHPYVKPNGFEFEVAPVPATTWFPSWNRGPIVFNYQDDARAEGAYLFVKYFLSDKVNAGWTKATVSLAPYSWTKATEEYKAYIGEDTPAIRAIKAVDHNLPIAGALPAVTGAAALRDYLKAAVEKAAAGEMTVEEAWNECVTLSNAALEGK